MNRRAFITLLRGGAAWPLAARAQQPEQMRKIGVLHCARADQPEATVRKGRLGDDAIAGRAVRDDGGSVSASGLLDLAVGGN